MFIFHNLLRLLLGVLAMFVGCWCIPSLQWFPVLAFCFGGWSMCGGWEWRTPFFDQSAKPFIVGLVSCGLGGLSLLLK